MLDDIGAETMTAWTRPKEREHAITKKYGAVFIIGIGCKLSNGEVHDMRAPDYDDYTTIDPQTGLPGLNGDLLVWDEVLDRSVIDTEAVDDRLVPRDPETSRLGIAVLWQWGKGTDLDKSETEVGHIIVKLAVLIKSSCQSNRIREGYSENFSFK